MEKVVPFFKSFITIFYFKNFEWGNVLFGWVKVGIELNYIWFCFNFKFELNLNHHHPALCLLHPLVSGSPSPIFSSSATCATRRPAPAALGPVSVSHRPGPPQPLSRGAPPYIGPPHCSCRHASLKRPEHHRRPLFSPLPPHHISLSLSARKATLSPVTRCPSYLTEVEAEAAAFSPLLGELHPLVHCVIYRAARHPPLSVALPQVHPEATIAHRSTPPSTKLHHATVLLRPAIDVPQRWVPGHSSLPSG
jgi:hypothetical protein